MTATEIALLCTLVGAVLSTATFFAGRRSASRDEGREAGSVQTRLAHLEEGHKERNRETKHMFEKIEDWQTDQATYFAAAVRDINAIKDVLVGQGVWPGAPTPRGWRKRK